jgi:hypothetical protein
MRARTWEDHMKKLVILLSYATEDQQLATTIAQKLTGAFGARTVDLRYNVPI